MIRPEFKSTLLEQRGAAVILWSLFMAAVGVYLFVARHFFGASEHAASSSFTATVRAVIWLLAAVDLGYLISWKRRYMTREALLACDKQAKLLRALEGHKGPVEERAASAVSTFVTRKIVAFAIIEALAVYGLVLAAVGPYTQDQYLLSALTLVLLAFEFPTQGTLTELVQTVETGIQP